MYFLQSDSTHTHTWSNGWLTRALLSGGLAPEAPPHAPAVNPKGSPLDISAAAVLCNQGAAEEEAEDEDTGDGPA